MPRIKKIKIPIVDKPKENKKEEIPIIKENKKITVSFN